MFVQANLCQPEDTMGKLKRKEQHEAELSQLEKDIATRTWYSSKCCRPGRPEDRPRNSGKAQQEEHPHQFRNSPAL